MTDLTEQALIDALTTLKDSGAQLFAKPTKMIILGPVREYLASQGYDTEEKVIELVNSLLMVTEPPIDEII